MADTVSAIRFECAHCHRELFRIDGGYLAVSVRIMVYCLVCGTFIEADGESLIRLRGELPTSRAN